MNRIDKIKIIFLGNKLGYIIFEKTQNKSTNKHKVDMSNEFLTLYNQEQVMIIGQSY